MTAADTRPEYTPTLSLYDLLFRAEPGVLPSLSATLAAVAAFTGDFGAFGEETLSDLSGEYSIGWSIPGV